MHAMQARAREDVVVLDNGGSSIKAGLASAPHGVRCAAAAGLARSRTLRRRRSRARRPHARSCVPNCAAKPKGEKRLYVGEELEECRDISALALRRPVEKGFVVNGQLQRDIWDRVFKRTLKARGARAARGWRAHCREGGKCSLARRREPLQAGGKRARRGSLRSVSPGCASRAGRRCAMRAPLARAHARLANPVLPLVRAFACVSPPQITPSDCSLLVTEPLFNLPALMARRTPLRCLCIHSALLIAPMCFCFCFCFC
jgi:hypothetical protein